MSENEAKGPDQEMSAEELWKGLPFLNIGALFMPPIWGPANGIWITILYYPLWVFCDNIFYNAYIDPQPMTIVFAVIVFIVMAAVTIMFARLSQGYACKRALEKGKTKEWYLRRQRVWAVAMVILAVVLLALATWYNLCVKPSLGM